MDLKPLVCIGYFIVIHAHGDDMIDSIADGAEEEDLFPLCSKHVLSCDDCGKVLANIRNLIEKGLEQEMTNSEQNTCSSGCKHVI